MDILRNTRKILKQILKTFNKEVTDPSKLQPAQQESPEQGDTQEKIPAPDTSSLQETSQKLDTQQNATEQQNTAQQKTKEELKAEQQKLIEQAVAAFNNGKMSQCLNCWEVIRKRFPFLPQGYIQAGFTALELSDFTLAEKLASQAIKKFPQEIEAFRLSAQVAMRSCAFNLALSRWALVRKHFPAQVVGYTQAGLTALELGKIPMAEKLLAEAEKQFSNEPAVVLLRNKINKIKQDASQKRQVTVQDLLDIAEKDFRMGLFRQAFAHFKRAMRHIPEQFRPFSGAAEAAMKLQDYPRAEKIAGEMISRFPLSIVGYQYLIQALEAQEKWSEALARLEDIKKNFPKNPYGWKTNAEILLKAGNYERADAEIKEAVGLFPKNFDISLYFAQLPLFSTDPKIQSSSMERCLTLCRNFSSQYNAYTEALNICRNLISIHDNNEYKDTYRHIFNNFLQHFNINQHNSIQTTKIAIYIRYSKEIKYFLPVIKLLPSSFIDIIIQNNDSEESLQEFEISNYNILYGDKNIKKYKYIIIDTHILATSKHLQNSDCCFIGYTHATDAAAETLKHLSLAIFESQNQMTSSQALPCAPLPDWYTLPAHADYKCEVCHTGLYHIGEFLERRHEEKSRIKAELAEQLGIDIPESKPFIFILQDEICHTGQLAYAANRMTEYATVLFKTLLPATDPRMTKFNNNVHILRGPLAPNLPRFAADFVCCGYMSGSFTTSVMLGQNVLPYYSRLVGAQNLNKAYFLMKRYDSVLSIAEPAFHSAKYALYTKFHGDGKLLDLVNAESFKNAILGTEYRNWYQSVLPSLQKEAFGDYMLEGAPQKTADYIMRFVKDGTLGKDCAAVYLKEKDFV